MKFLDLAGVKQFKDYTDETFVSTEDYSVIEDVNRDTYTKQEIDTMISDIESGGSDLTNYYTKSQADSKFVEAVSGKQLSTNDYTTAEKNKLSEIESGAQANVQADWSVTNSSSDAYIKNKPSSLPASDVSAWAKAANKPTYTASEVGAQETLVSGTNIKTINNESLLGSGNITISAGSGEANVINTVKVNGTALTPDSNKAVNITVPTTLDQISDGSTRKLSNYLPLEGGSLQNTSSGDTELIVTDGYNEDYVKLAVTESGEAPHVEIFENGSGYTRFYYDKIQRDSYTDINLPSNSGTLALTSDIPASSTLVHTSGDETIAGGKSFTDGIGAAHIDVYGDVNGENAYITCVSERGFNWLMDVNNNSVQDALDAKQNLITSTNKLDYSLLDNTPTIPSLAGYATEQYVDEELSAAIISLSLSLNSTDYKITLSGTKANGTTFTVSDVIDLPLESVVVNGSYDDTTKKVVLTLKNGNTIDFSIADLIAGLQSEITSTNKLSADLIADGTTNKVVTATEKSTWNGKQDAISDLATIRSNAEAGAAKISNVQSDWNATSGLAQILNKPTIPAVGEGELTIKVNGTTIETFGANQGDDDEIDISIPTESTVSGWGFTKNAGTVTQVKVGNTSYNPSSGVVSLPAYPTSLPASDVSAWAKASSKPTYTASEVGALPSTTVIPDAANNATITIQKGGTTVDSFTVNASSNKSINIPDELPSYSASDSGKILSVNSSGQLVWITPSYIYSGSATPDSNTGNNGDIYLQV